MTIGAANRSTMTHWTSWTRLGSPTADPRPPVTVMARLVPAIHDLRSAGRHPRPAFHLIEQPIDGI